MKKFILFAVCLILSAGVLALSLIQNSVTCLKSEDRCVFNSTIQYLNIELNKEVFPLESINRVSCEKKSQPSKKGRKNYYLLKIDINERPYNIATYTKYQECKAVSNNIKKEIKDTSINKLAFTSSSGTTNALGIIFAFIIFIVGIIILKTEDIPEETLDEEEE